jgi:uncharacterized protein with WD repeat|tara:strand:- start:380 stop:691 length:312 start_codon:yes stop_codon:yes gene_type:complete
LFTNFGSVDVVRYGYENDARVDFLCPHPRYVVVTDLTDFESRLLKWISASDFIEVAWSTKRAAEAFKVEEKDVYEALAALTRKARDHIQIFYDGGAIRIVANY